MLVPMSEQSTGRGEWTRSGAYEVAPGVHRVPLPLPNDGLRAVNVYVVGAPEPDGGLVLVDSGWSIPEARELLVAALESLGRTLLDVRRFLVTHVHRDHYTQAIAIRRELGTPVALGLGERPSLDITRNPDRMPLQQQLQGLRAMGAGDLAEFLDKQIAGHERPHRSDWELPDEWLTAGDVDAGGGRTFEVVPTPGHTRGHVVFHDLANGLLFAGDHVLPTITPSIGFEPVLSPNPLGDFLSSLALVRARPDARLLPAHGPVTDSVHARVDELVAHHGARLDETQAAVAAGATTAYDVARQLKWTRRLRALDELDPFNQMLAIAETGAHLQLLAAQERVTATDDGDVRRYVTSTTR
jgi:glyoxylase-like metal-dependent hydrolase (beta-lactamase superfamily II)